MTSTRWPRCVASRSAITLPANPAPTTRVSNPFVTGIQRNGFARPCAPREVRRPRGGADRIVPQCCGGRTVALSCTFHREFMPPVVSIVFLVYNRCDELRISLQRTLAADYDPACQEIIVVDNASTDGSAEMVRSEFPSVRVLTHPRNVGVSGWIFGLAAATGEYLLLLDDDCYLPEDGLSDAVAAAERHRADMVSFKVVSTDDPTWEFTDKYRTGLFMFWGCAVLMRRGVAQALTGYDPEIFFLANELEFTLRFFDHGYRHLHLPQVVAQHMKRVPGPDDDPDRWIDERSYRINARNWGYIVGKLFRAREAGGALVALLARVLRDGLRIDHLALKAIPDTLAGFAHGVRHRAPLANPELSRVYRHNFETFASPWWVDGPSERCCARFRERCSQAIC